MQNEGFNEDIWAEKPDPSDEKYWVWKEPNEKYGIADLFHFESFIEDRDAWLEKVKAEGDRFKEKAEQYDEEHKAAMIVEEELRKIEDKLEAVNEWLKNEFVMSPVNPPWYTKRIRQIADILEAEG